MAKRPKDTHGKLPPSRRAKSRKMVTDAGHEFDRFIEQLRSMPYKSRFLPKPNSADGRLRKRTSRSSSTNISEPQTIDQASKKSRLKATANAPPPPISDASMANELKTMQDLHEAYEHLNYGAVLDAIALCSKGKYPAPKWLLSAAYELMAAWMPGNVRGRIRRQKGTDRTSNVVRRLSDARRHYLRWDFIEWVLGRQFIEGGDRARNKRPSFQDRQKWDLLGNGKINAFASAAYLLEGTEIAGTEATMRYSYDRMQRTFSDRKLASELMLLSDETSADIGLPELDWSIVFRNLEQRMK